MQSLRRFGRALLAAPLVVAGLSCTELTEVPQAHAGVGERGELAVDDARCEAHDPIDFSAGAA